MGKVRETTPYELSVIEAQYQEHARIGTLDILAMHLKRSRKWIDREARQLGIPPEKKLRGACAKASVLALQTIMECMKASRLGTREFCKRHGLPLAALRKACSGTNWALMLEAKAPKQSMYKLGRSFEYRTRDRLRAAGYFVVRAAQSKGAADLVGIRQWLDSLHPEVVVVQCKRTGNIGPAEREAFYTLAERICAVPIVASMKRGKGVAFKELVGPNSLMPWEAKP